MIRALALCLALAPAAARACAVAEPYAVTDIAAWPIVAVVEVTGYSRADTLEGRLTLSVVELLRGTAPDSFEAEWGVSMSELAPFAWDRPARVIAAFQPPESGNLFRLAVEMCGNAMLAEASEANLAAVRAALP